MVDNLIYPRGMRAGEIIQGLFELVGFLLSDRLTSGKGTAFEPLTNLEQVPQAGALTNVSFLKRKKWLRISSARFRNLSTAAESNRSNGFGR